MYNVRLNIGIGDLIYSKSLLLSCNQDVYIRMAYQYLNYRGIDYKLFLDDFSSRLFCEPKFHIVEDNEYPPSVWWDLLQMGLTPCPIRLDDLCYGKSLCYPYVCMHTKVRGDFGNSMDKETFIASWNKIKDAINDISSSFRIVLIGEREIEANDEYIKHSNNTIFSLYPEASSELSNITDLTVQGLSSPTMDKFRQDCLYMSEAECNISIGVGGNMAIMSSVGNAIHFTRHDPCIAKEVFGSRYSSANDPISFAKLIRSIGDN